MIHIHVLPTLKDNYTYILQGGGQTAVIDAGEAAPVIAFLQEHSLNLDLIVNTHHHGDHIAGNTALKEKYNCPIAAPEKEASKIGNFDLALNEDSVFEVCGERVTILETPGHTLGHICLFFSESKALFSADTLFSLGCGRLFEGTADQMWNSLQKIMALPDDTNIYCGHEYTLSNAEFCLNIEPDNEALRKRYKDVQDMRKSNKPTIPTTLSLEKETNVFLRAGSAVRFAEIRTLKDNA